MRCDPHAVRVVESERASTSLRGVCSAKCSFRALHVHLAHKEVSAVERLLRPADPYCVGNTCRRYCPFDRDVGHVVSRSLHGFDIVALPIALQSEDVVRGSEEAVLDRRVATAEPIHAVLVGIIGVTANYLDVEEADVAGVAHLDLPGAAAGDAGDAVNLNVLCEIHDNAMPVRLVHPAFIGVRVLGAVVEDGSLPEDAYVLYLPHIERSKDDCTAVEVDAIAGFSIDVFVMNSRSKVADLRVLAEVWRGFAEVREEEEHVRIGEVVTGPSDG